MSVDYKQYFKEELERFKEDVGELIYAYFPENKDISTIQPLELLNIIKSVTATIEELEQLQIQEFSIDIPGYVKRKNIEKINAYSSQLARYADPYEQKKEVLTQQREQAILVAKAQLDTIRKEKRLALEDALKNHTALMNRKEEVESLLKLYELDFDAYEAEVNMLSIQELEKNSKIALSALNRVTRSPDIIRSSLRLIYYPLVAEMDTKEQSLVLKISWTISFILLCYIGRPFFLAIVAMLYFISCISSLLDKESKRKILQMAYSFMVEVNMDEYIEDDPDILDAMLQVDEAEDIDLTDEFEKLDKECEEAKKAIEATNPSDTINKEVSEAVAFVQSEEYTNAIKSMTDYISYEKKRILEANKAYLDGLVAQREHIKGRLQMLGSSITMNEYLDPRIKIGCLYDENGNPFVESSVNIGARNTWFSYKSLEHRAELVDYMKLLLCNYMCNIREKRLTVSIYDSEYLGREFVEFCSDTEMKSYVTIHSKELKKKLDNLSTELMVRNKKLNGKTIYEYNKESQEIGKVTLDYELVIILSSEHDYIRDNMFLKYLQFSQDVGIIFWVLAKDASIEEEAEAQKAIHSAETGLCRVIDYGEYLDTDGQNMAELPEGFKPYSYDMQMGYTVVNKFLACINDKNRNSASLLYEEGYRQKYIPDDKIWTYSTLKGIEIRFGLVDGDPDKPMAYVLGDANVHMLMGGQTGAGKSATINEFIANMLYMYPPEQLELVMVDFKNVEFKMYTGKYAIPHTSIIAGTKDGEYAISIFQYLIDEMNRRIKLLGSKQFNHMMLWNNWCMENDRMDLYLPRIAVIVDEFQTMFNNVEQKALEQIKKLIADVTRLARFCGVHLIFTSQSMKDTLSKDVLDNFSLRAALRCTAEVSSQIIGNDASSKIKERFGWITINDSTGNDPSANKLFRIPFISEECIHTYIPMLREKCKKENHIDRAAKFYDEDEVHPAEDLMKWYDSYPQIFAKDINGEATQTFVLGERTSYSTNKLPANFAFERGYNDNLLFSAYDIAENCKFVDSMIWQLQQKEIPYIIHCPDLELIDVMGLEDKVYAEGLKGWLSDGLMAEKIVSAVVAAVEERKENPELWDKPFYFIGMGWDSIQGLGRNENNRLTEGLKQALYEGPKYNCHFIIVVSTLQEMRYWKSNFKKVICAYHDEKESNFALDNIKAPKLPEGFAIYKSGKQEHKFKLYKFKLAREFKAKEAYA